MAANVTAELEEALAALSFKEQRLVLAEVEAELSNRRLDQYVPNDKQREFHRAGARFRQRLLRAGNQQGKCATASSFIDHPDGTRSTYLERYNAGARFRVTAWDAAGEVVDAWAVQPIKKPPEPCVRLWMADGNWFEVALNHRVLLPDGSYAFVSALLDRAPCLRPTRDEPLAMRSGTRASGAPRWKRSAIGFLGHCLSACRLGDARLHGVQAAVRSWLRRPSDVQVHSCEPCGAGAGHPTHTSNRRSGCGHPSSSDVLVQIGDLCAGFVDRGVCTISLRTRASIRVMQRLLLAWCTRLRSVDAGAPGRSLQAWGSPGEGNQIVAYETIPCQEVYDFTVPRFRNYYASGAFHHNTMCAGAEVAMHLTGRYPDWWDGRVFEKPTVAWAAGVSSNALRDGVQRMLFGRLQKRELRGYGTGMIPKDALRLPPSWRQHSNDVIDTAVIRHGGGGDVQAGQSMIVLKSYEQGPTVFQSDTLDFVWLDEEPPYKIYTECLTRTNRTLGPIFITFTPLMGMTETVKTFMIDRPAGSHVTHMTIDDATFYTDAEREQIIAGYKPHERAARVMGIPALGSGRVFPFPRQMVSCQAFKIPPHWYHLVGLDIGWDHPTAFSWLAWDKDTNRMFCIATYKRSEAGVADHARVLRAWGQWLPVAWPHDGLQHDKSGHSEETIAQQYRDEGVNMLREYATHDPIPDPKHPGQMKSAGNGVEAGVSQMYDEFQDGRLQVFEHLNDFWEEFELYHRMNGVIVPAMDDVLSATRYARMMRRFAVQKPRAGRERETRPANWRTA